MYVLDRREIEGIRDVKKLIQSHLDDVQEHRHNPDRPRPRPLSLAVFGPPGAGKSVAVKGVIESFKYHPAKPELLPAYNLAQFSGGVDLDRAFKEITDTSANYKVPIVFFDEFDAQFDGQPWGWLKFFLAPMEDGEYRGGPVNTAVFVFAGGTSPTYAEFSLEERANTDPQVQAFAKAKGPDFVSRLKGHFDVVGVNPADTDDSLHLIRRAAVVRDILSVVQNLAEGEEARIDDDVLRAILFVPQYRNGARSIRKLIEICRRSAERLTNGSLPPTNQLNMVTDGKAFLDRLNNVSSERNLTRR